MARYTGPARLHVPADLMIPIHVVLQSNVDRHGGLISWGGILSTPDQRSIITILKLQDSAPLAISLGEGTDSGDAHIIEFSNGHGDLLGSGDPPARMRPA